MNSSQLKRYNRIQGYGNENEVRIAMAANQLRLSHFYFPMGLPSIIYAPIPCTEKQGGIPDAVAAQFMWAKTYHKETLRTKNSQTRIDRILSYPSIIIAYENGLVTEGQFYFLPCNITMSTDHKISNRTLVEKWVPLALVKRLQQLRHYLANQRQNKSLRELSKLYRKPIIELVMEKEAKGNLTKTKKLQLARQLLLKYFHEGRYSPDSHKERFSPDSHKGRYSPNSHKGRYSPDSQQKSHNVMDWIRTHYQELVHKEFPDVCITSSKGSVTSILPREKKVNGVYQWQQKRMDWVNQIKSVEPSIREKLETWSRATRHSQDHQKELQHYTKWSNRLRKLGLEVPPLPIVAEPPMVIAYVTKCPSVIKGSIPLSNEKKKNKASS